MSNHSDDKDDNGDDNDQVLPDHYQEVTTKKNGRKITSRK